LTSIFKEKNQSTDFGGIDKEAKTKQKQNKEKRSGVVTVVTRVVMVVEVVAEVVVVVVIPLGGRNQRPK
jgi:uncharacterized protein YqhQ